MTQLLSPYIITLLELHHCVILPSLGAFVMSTKPAFWDKEDQMILPLSKNLVFNKNLTHEDGLLTNHVAQARQISYEAAVEWVRWQIKLLHQELNQGEHCLLEKIGTLFRKDNTIVFVKDPQFQIPFESFGLATVVIAPKLIPTNLIQSSTTFDMNTPKIPLKNKTKSKKQKLGPSLLILLILTLLLTGIYYLFFASKKSVETLTINQSLTESALDLPEEEWEDEDEDEELFAESDKKLAIETGKIYYLVAGVYQVKKNALHMVDSLKSSGFVHAAIVDQVDQKYRVAFSEQPFTTLEQAQIEKDRLDDMGYNSWIFIKEEK